MFRRDHRTTACQCFPLHDSQSLFDQLLAFKPYQLDDELERAFLERAQTANSAWIRLYDETLTALRYDVRGKELTGEEALHLLSEPERDTRD